MKFLLEMYLWTGKLIKFWKSFTSNSGSRNSLKDSSTLQDWAFFHNLAHLCKNWSNIHENFTTDVSLNRKFPSYILLSYPALES